MYRIHQAFIPYAPPLPAYDIDTSQPLLWVRPDKAIGPASAVKPWPLPSIARSAPLGSFENPFPASHPLPVPIRFSSPPRARMTEHMSYNTAQQRNSNPSTPPSVLTQASRQGEESGWYSPTHEMEEARCHSLIPISPSGRNHTALLSEQQALLDSFRQPRPLRSASCTGGFLDKSCPCEANDKRQYVPRSTFTNAPQPGSARRTLGPTPPLTEDPQGTRGIPRSKPSPQPKIPARAIPSPTTPTPSPRRLSTPPSRSPTRNTYYPTPNSTPLSRPQQPQTPSPGRPALKTRTSAPTPHHVRFSLPPEDAASSTAWSTQARAGDSRATTVPCWKSWHEDRRYAARKSLSPLWVAGDDGRQRSRKKYPPSPHPFPGRGSREVWD